MAILEDFTLLPLTYLGALSIGLQLLVFDHVPLFPDLPFAFLFEVYHCHDRESMGFEAFF